MSQFPRFPSPGLWIQPGDDPERLRVETGFPHSDIPGWQPAHGFPRLIAVFHVLHRHLAPRHPPHALGSLDNVMRRTRCSSDAAIQLLRFAPMPCGLGSGARPLVPEAPDGAAGTGGRASFGKEPARHIAGPRGQERLCWDHPYSVRRFAFASDRTHHLNLVEMRGFEPLTSALQKQRSPS